MNKLINFIESNLVEFNNLENSEVIYLESKNVDNEIVEYLENIFRNRFDYKNICVYYIEENNNKYICVENMID